MTKRELYIDDLRQMEDSLIWLEDNKATVSTWGVLRAVCRALYHLLTNEIKSIDERSRK